MGLQHLYSFVRPLWHLACICLLLRLPSNALFHPQTRVSPLCSLQSAPVHLACQCAVSSPSPCHCFPCELPSLCPHHPLQIDRHPSTSPSRPARLACTQHTTFLPPYAACNRSMCHIPLNPHALQTTKDDLTGCTGMAASSEHVNGVHGPQSSCASCCGSCSCMGCATAAPCAPLKQWRRQVGCEWGGQRTLRKH